MTTNTQNPLQAQYPTNQDTMATVKDQLSFNQGMSNCKIIEGAQTSAECIKDAGLDWRLNTFPVSAPNLVSDDDIEIPGYQAITRSDSNEVLSIMGKDYRIIDNEDAFEFFDGVVDTKQAIYDAAGSLNGGRKVFIMAKLNDNMFIDPSDEVERRIMLHTSHDGTASLVMKQVAIQMNCTNAFSFYLGKRYISNQIKIRHTKAAKGKIVQAQKALKLSVGYFDDLNSILKNLRTRPMDTTEMTRFTEKLVPDNEDAKNTTRTENIRNQMQIAFTRGHNVQGRNRYSALNAVTEYTTHDASTRVRKGETEHDGRFDSNMFGGGARLAQRAFDLLLEN